MRKFLFISALVISASANASTDIANQLGRLVASEDLCDLSYKPGAISAFVEKAVAQNNLDFADTLELMTAAQGVELEYMSASAKDAHCTQMRRAAKEYGFID